MVHFKDVINPEAIIIGKLLSGGRNFARVLKEQKFVKIRGFYCEIFEECNDETKKQMEMCGSVHFNISDSMSGDRGILEPAMGYNGPDMINKKRKPPKDSTHGPAFDIDGDGNQPAMCYFDNFASRQERIKLSKANLLTFSAKT